MGKVMRVGLVLGLVWLLVTFMPQPALQVAAAPRRTPTPRPSATATPFQYIFPLQNAKSIWYPPCHHDYPAADIFVPVGTQFVAPISGRVEWVTTTDEWQPKTDDPATRGGLSVALLGDDGVRYYGSHLSAVTKGIVVGVRVKRGQSLGLTGKSGSARDTDPHLHFGISRPTTAADWATRRGHVPPYTYLNAWRKGSNITPDLTLRGGVC